jgi:O-antigen ligase
MTLALPLIVVIAFAVAPATTRERLRSVLDPHGETDSNRHRYVTFWTGVAMVQAHPWFGLGPEQIRQQFDAYVPAYIKRPLPVGYYGHLHNIYVQYAAERGIPGLLLLLWVIGMTAFDCFRTVLRIGKQPSQQLFWLHGTIAVIIGVLAGGLFEYNLGDSEVLMMFTSVVGLSYAAVDQACQQSPAVSPDAEIPLPDEQRKLSHS